MTTWKSNCHPEDIKIRDLCSGSRPQSAVKIFIETEMMLTCSLKLWLTPNQPRQLVEPQQENSSSLFAPCLAVKENYVAVALITSHCLPLIGPTQAEFQNISNSGKMFCSKIIVHKTFYANFNKCFYVSKNLSHTTRTMR